jgi:hypothetical protein
MSEQTKSHEHSHAHNDSHEHTHSHRGAHEHIPVHENNRHVHGGPAVLDIGEDVGALLIYCHPQLRGEQIDVSPRERLQERTHTDVLERNVLGRSIFAALFLALDAGVYVIWNHGDTPICEVTINGGQVSELNWLQESPQILLGSHARDHQS